MMNKSYYAVIPAEVRYDKDLSPNAKLLYGELTALSNESGYCWATNAYFIDLYEVDERSIRRWISLLNEKGFINVEIDKMSGNSRKIFINKIFSTLGTKLSGGGDMEIPTWGQNCPEVGTKLSGGGDKIVHPYIDNITLNNTINNTTTTRSTGQVEIFKENILADRGFLERQAMKWHIDIPELLTAIDDFFTTKNDTHEYEDWKREKDCRRNLVFWLGDNIARLQDERMPKKQVMKNTIKDFS